MPAVFLTKAASFTRAAAGELVGICSMNICARERRSQGFQKMCNYTREGCSGMVWVGQVLGAGLPLFKC